MTFSRNLLPDPVSYFENRGLTLKGPRSAQWKTIPCNFHGGSDSLRVHVATGAWVCMSCGEKGGDVLAYEMRAGGLEFVDAAKALGCWVNDGRPSSYTKPTPLSPRMALTVMAFEATLIAVAASNLASGVPLTGKDQIRLVTAANRINRLVEDFA
jgi:hypothetical protein